MVMRFSPRPFWPMAAAWVLVVAAGLSVGCKNVPTGEPAVIAARRSPPSMSDLEKLQRDAAALAADRERVSTELATLESMSEPSDLDRERAGWRRAELDRLGVKKDELAAREEAILDRLATDPGAARTLEEAIAARLSSMSRTAMGRRQEVAEAEITGERSGARAVAASQEIARLRGEAEFFESWRDRVGALSGRSVARETGWPVLSGALERRRAARMTEDTMDTPTEAETDTEETDEAPAEEDSDEGEDE